MDHGSWTTQLRKGALDAAVMGVLARRGSCYGLELLDAFNAAGLPLTEGALYPLLARLEKSGMLAGRWRLDEGAARPRKYYALTESGAAMFETMKASWPAFRDQIDMLITKGGAAS